jgi:hypothetical protein
MKTMDSVGGSMMEAQEFSFTANVEFFDRPGGWFYVAVPIELSAPLIPLADRGLIAITARVGNTQWHTSLLPMGDGTHFIALPAKVRKQNGLSLCDEVSVSFTIRER